MSVFRWKWVLSWNDLTLMARKRGMLSIDSQQRLQELVTRICSTVVESRVARLSNWQAFNTHLEVVRVPWGHSGLKNAKEPENQSLFYWVQLGTKSAAFLTLAVHTPPSSGFDSHQSRVHLRKLFLLHSTTQGFTENKQLPYSRYFDTQAQAQTYLGEHSPEKQQAGNARKDHDF